jgi:hypothetical protein
MTCLVLSICWFQSHLSDRFRTQSMWACFLVGLMSRCLHLQSEIVQTVKHECLFSWSRVHKALAQKLTGSGFANNCFLDSARFNLPDCYFFPMLCAIYLFGVGG